MNKYREIEELIIKSMKEKDKENLSGLKVFKSEILKVAKDSKLDITNDLVEKVADKLKKEMEKSLVIVEDSKNRLLHTIVSKYIIQKTTELELLNWLKYKFGNKGELMKQAKEEFGSKLDGKLLNSLIK